MKRLAWSILMVFPFGAFAAEVYRTVDDNGLVAYSDRPSEAAERIVIDTIDPPAPVATRSAADANEAGETTSNLSPIAELPREVTAEEVAANRAENCQTARERAEAYSIARRLFRDLPNGDREYLSDAEIDEARARAQSDVASWCD